MLSKLDVSFGNVVNCSNITCSQTLCEGSTKDECCEECYVSDSEQAEDFQMQDEAKFPCLHSGRVYQDGEEFSSNATDLQAEKPNQCIHCICKTRMVFVLHFELNDKHFLCLSFTPKGLERLVDSTKSFPIGGVNRSSCSKI
ncbi:chordin-like protein 1 [Caerostris extrusa]|uniref:Chordin-like protein 1 n=1 Tax=Caerostris extrusa TaxID=172846 RepID=A0AAV4MAG3_CAEEX|nr:chordin-like protein 1 [Caerostris extrusa]